MTNVNVRNSMFLRWKWGQRIRSGRRGPSDACPKAWIESVLYLEIGIISGKSSRFRLSLGEISKTHPPLRKHFSPFFNISVLEKFYGEKVTAFLFAHFSYIVKIKFFKFWWILRILMFDKLGKVMWVRYVTGLTGVSLLVLSIFRSLSIPKPSYVWYVWYLGL